MRSLIYDREWWRLSVRHRKAFPFCRACGRPGKHVDHIIPVRIDPSRRLDPTNLQTLCHRCHSIVTAAFDVGRLVGACDAQGRPLDPNHPWSDGAADWPMRADAGEARRKQSMGSGIEVGRRLKADWISRNRQRRNR